jgi:hypothetical protein
VTGQTGRIQGRLGEYEGSSEGAHRKSRGRLGISGHIVTGRGAVVGIGSLIKGVPGFHRVVDVRTILSLVAAACVMALAVGCGSGAVSGPDGGSGDHSPEVGAAGKGRATDNSGGGAGRGKGGTGGGDKYSWWLPPGPTGTNPPADVYGALQAGFCGEAESALDGGQIIGPDDEPLFRAGVDLCRGEVANARAHLAAYHWPGSSDAWVVCHLYRAVASVVHQRPRTSIVASCPPIPPVSPESSGGSDEPSSSGSSENPQPPGPSDEPPASGEPNGAGP